ncbi:hypothetical protein [Novosphingobium sp.]|uniref:hypothetical protein n=1 Tax=Novosphingobium sp. TaxID=1874826 RepID=UPI0033419B8D
MINIERDSHGRTYQIWKQDQANSCGVASIWMARGIARQTSFAEEEWGLAQRVYSGAVANALTNVQAPNSGPMSLNPAAFTSNQSTMQNTFASFGLYMGQVASALRNEGLRAENTPLTGNPPRIADNKISLTKPAIVLISWDGSGGHFVVVGRCTSREVSFLDPWDGRVNEQPNNGEYTARYGGHGTIVAIVYVSA